MSDSTKTDNQSTVISDNLDGYVDDANAYGGLLLLLPKNLPQNNMVRGSMVRNFYGQSNGAAFAGDIPVPSVNAERGCSVQFAYNEPMCTK